MLNNAVESQRMLVPETVELTPKETALLLEYADVLAYILSVNGYPVGNDELPPDPAELKKLAIVPNGK